MSEAGQRYLIALGSNMRHPRHGPPARILNAAVAAIGERAGRIVAVSPTMRSRPLGPSRREYANAALVVASDRDPPAMLAALQAIEHAFARQRRGARWQARTLDCDIVLWSGGCFVSADLTIPHPLFRQRDFVLIPAAQIAPDWRDPVTHRSLRQLRAHAQRQRA